MAHKNLLRDGGTDFANWPTVLKTDEATPPVVAPGIISRLSTLVARNQPVVDSIDGSLLDGFLRFSVTIIRSRI
ncbi:MAG TPA: hypothetical protein DE312_01200 [Gallionella sp.]|nr:MAG: hypothetical protein A2Z87_02895 [Gallionellales bacterium GWA2_54_124]OGT20498.1 MAG: hypothetical protein A2522_10775 [Gallionellales bacterium RIFOXYD12_FULL_53_10]HCI51941.1 hypothetical protein [Gallionella sp.]